MPFDVSAGSFAATAINVLFWWTVLSPLGLLAIAVLCTRRLRLRLWLTVSILVPPILVLLPVTVMHAGPWRFGTAGAALLDGAGVVLAVAALVRLTTRPQLAARVRGRRSRARRRRRHARLRGADGRAHPRLTPPPHDFLTTCVPCGVSRTSKPAACISSRSRSASDHRFSAR